jgi:outer membrane protein
VRMLFALLCLGLACHSALAVETLDLDQAIKRALNTDPRIEEQQQFVNAARSLLEEVEGHGDWFVKSNTFLALAPRSEGSIFKNGVCVVAQCELRDDRYQLNGVSPWFRMELSLIKPLYTFGKLENYHDAAEANIRIKSGDVQLQRNATVLDVKKAYYGYLAAHNSRQLLEDVAKRLDKAIKLVQDWLDEGKGEVKQADLYALQSGKALVAKYEAQAEALEKVALDGLKVLTGIPLSDPLELADKRIRPLEPPQTTLEELQQQALAKRPEMGQLEAGLQARRSLIKASKAERKPDVYAGFAGLFSYTPGRDRLDNPYIYDPFNDFGLTPMVGLRWNWSPGVTDAKTKEAKAELNALIAKSSFARNGIPYQVAEQYYQVQGNYEAVQKLEDASRSARRWMVASYTDFEAGLEKAEKIMTAMQAYVLATTDYLQTTYEYNMYVAHLQDVAGTNQ